MKKKYELEREGQIDFFNNFRIDYLNNEVLIDNTDGVWNGNLFEFKLNIDNLNKVLLQAIKYLSKMRVKGESVPSNILLVDLNNTTIYLYESKDYFEEIHKIYVGSASKDNEGFVGKSPKATFDYSNATDTIAVQQILKKCEFLPIRLDEDCIVGWAERYYREHPTATKGDFLGDDRGQVKIIGEIREPKHFKGLILPYEGKTNEKFKYLMDKLNDRLKKKDLGAFYTPIPYAEKSAELVRMAIERVPKGNDYVIIDRCAGTGNLESVLTDEELSHCILSTYEYYEYKVLCERLADKVRFIVPPTESLVEYSNGCILNADAMSERFINNPDVKKYIDNPNCTIILFENPPYADSSSSTFNDGDKTKQYKTNRKELFVTKEYIKKMANINESRNSSQELSNLFIWSAFEYYLRQPTDSYIVFSPVKYFKSIHLVKNKMIKGFAFNRKHFHATDSVISCVYWSNEIDLDSKQWDLECYDIEDDTLVPVGNVTVKKCYKTLADSIQKKSYADDIETNVMCASDGTPEVYSLKKGRKPVYNENIIGYYVVGGYAINAINRYLVRCNWKSGISKTMGNHLRKDTYLNILPMFSAKLYPQDNWFDKDIYFTTSDGGNKYTEDKEFLKYCLIYTCLSNQNKCLSFKGSDNRDYQNELCFEENALAFKDLQKFRAEIGLNAEEEELLALWSKILSESKQTQNYDSHWNYGVYQITKELNTYEEVKVGKSKKNVYDYPELNGDLISLRDKLKAYYKKYITPKMFEYELIK